MFFESGSLSLSLSLTFAPIGWSSSSAPSAPVARGSLELFPSLSLSLSRDWLTVEGLRLWKKIEFRSLHFLPLSLSLTVARPHAVQVRRRVIRKQLRGLALRLPVAPLRLARRRRRIQGGGAGRRKMKRETRAGCGRTGEAAKQTRGTLSVCDL